MSVLKNAIAALAIFLFRLFSIQDYMLFLGLALLGYGCHMVYPPAAFLAPGAILIFTAIFASVLGGKR